MAAVVGSLVFFVLYVLVAIQQFTRYAHPAGMDLSIAGVVPREAVGILVHALWPVMLGANAILCAFHVGAGAVLGALAGSFWNTVFAAAGRTLSRRRQSVLVAATLLVVAGLAFCTVAVRYPFQADHLLNGQGGLRRAFHVMLTTRLNPEMLEAALWAIVALFALAALRTRRRWPIALAVLVVGSLGVSDRDAVPPAPARNAGPNIVLILLESARGDYFSVNGYPRPTSPALERLVADGGVTFTDAWAHSNGTVESVATIMMSAYQHRHGIRSMFHNDDFARPGLPALPALLQRHGYATRVVADWDGDVTYFNERVLPGFDRYDVAEFGVVNYVKQIYGQYFVFYALTDNRLGHRLFSTFYRAGGGFTPAGGDDYYRQRIETHLAELARTPRFFLTVFFSNAHFNYRCRHPYYARFTDPGYEGPSKYQAMANPLAASPRERDGEARQIRGLYAGCVAALDDNVGFVVETLRRLGVDRRTIVVVTGDHGERLPDGRSFNYGRNGAWLSPPEFHVPLVIAAPMRPAARRTVAATARHVDIMPTILDLARLPVPAGLDGVSLVPLMTGAAGDLALDVFGETGFHWTPVGPPFLGYPPMTEVVTLHLDARGWLIPRYFLRPACLTRITLAKHRFIRTARYHLNYRPTVDGARLELYDWTVDPEHERNLAAARPEVTAALRDRLFAWARGDGALAVRDGRLVARDGDSGACAPRT